MRAGPHEALMRQPLLAVSIALAATGTAGAAGDIESGKRRALAACASCHGPQGRATNPDWPRLDGQNAPYLVKQLQAFKSGARKDSIMSPQARLLSEQDMHDLAAYFAAQAR